MSLGGAARGQGTITLKAATRLAPDAPVTVADVATLTGPEAEALGGVVIVSAAERAAGRESVSAQRLRDAIDRRDGAPVNWGRLTLGGGTCAVLPPLSSDTPRVPRPAPAADREAGTVRGAIAARLCHLLAVERADLRLSFDDADRSILDLSVAGRTVDVRPTGLSEKIPLAVTVYEAAGTAQGRIVGARTVRVGVQVRRSVVLAGAAKRRGDLIGPGDVTVEERWVGPSAPPLALERIVGAAVRTRLTAGEPIGEQDIQPPLVVQRGELVSVHCVSGLVVVRMTARALGEARDGEIVKLQSLSDEKRTFHGRMDGRGRAVAVASDGAGANP